MRIFIDPGDDGCFWKCLCYMPLFSEKNWNTGYIPIKEFNRYQEVYIIFNFYFNPSILLNIYKILCHQGLQFSYVFLRIVFFFWVLYVLTLNINSLCPMLLDCAKQQLIISFSLSLHNMWFLRTVCMLTVPVIWKPRIFSLFPASLHSCHPSSPD